MNKDPHEIRRKISETAERIKTRTAPQHRVSYTFVMPPDRSLKPGTMQTPDEFFLFNLMIMICQVKDLALHPTIEMSIKELCDRSNVGERRVRRALQGLDKKGWIDIMRQGCHRVNQYRLYEAPRSIREAPKTLEEVQRKLRDPEVVAKLTKGLYPGNSEN